MPVLRGEDGRVFEMIIYKVLDENCYSDMEINKMTAVGNAEYKELTAAVAKVVLEHIWGGGA